MRSGKLPRPGKHTPVHHQQVEEITHWHGSAEAVGKVTNQAGTHCDHRDGHRNRELSPRPDRIGENAPERNSEGTCSNKMSVVGHIHNPSNKPSFFVQPTLPELQRLVEVMESLPTDVPAGIAAMIELAEQPPVSAPTTNATAMTEAARQLPPRKVKRDATDAPDGTAVTPNSVIAGMDEYRCCIESRQQDSVSAPYRVRRRLLV